jgi:hypothetical protein
MERRRCPPPWRGSPSPGQALAHGAIGSAIARIAAGFGTAWGAYTGAIDNVDAIAAIRLTLLTAAISVPLNLVFGIAASHGRSPSSISRARRSSSR